MAASVDHRSVSVFSVGLSRQFAGPKRPLAEVARLPVFSVSPATTWDQEHLRNRAQGETSWFLLGTAPRVTIFWYRENGGIPYAAVAARPRTTSVRLASSATGHVAAEGRLRAFRSAAGQPMNMLSTVLQAPEHGEPPERTSWLAQLTNRRSRDATNSPSGRQPTLRRRLLFRLGKYTRR